MILTSLNNTAKLSVNLFLNIKDLVIDRTRQIYGAVNNSKKNKKKNNFTFDKKKKKFLLIGGGLLILLVLWHTYAIAPQIHIFAEAQTITVKKQQDVTANFDATDGIKAFVRTETVNGSDNISTTGNGKVGQKATGAVRATYLQASGSITLKAGTMISCFNPADCNNQSLNFKILQDTTFSLVTSPVSINVEAENIGADYNLKSGVKFKVPDLAQSDISVTNVSPFTGGESKDTRTVDPKDIDSLKSRLTDTLKSQASQKILSDLGTNNEIIQDKLKVNVKEVKTDKNAGDESDSLNMDMTMDITAYGYDKTTVRPFIENLLKQDEKDNLKLDLTSVQIDQKIKSSNDKGIVLSLTGNGKLKPEIDKDSIINSLLNKSLSDVKPTLEKVPNLKNITYSYTPNWPPEFMKHIPGNKSNVILEIKEIE